MRTPFDTDDSSWWATHGASSSKLPVAKAIDLEPPFEPSEYVSVAPDEDAFAASTAEELTLRELIDAQERETVKDVSLVRTAAALASEQALL